MSITAEKLEWTKFHSIFGPDLKIALESNFPASQILTVRDEMQKELLSCTGQTLSEIWDAFVPSLPGPLRRVYWPARIIKDSPIEIEFTPLVMPEGEAFKRLVFRRKRVNGKNFRYSVACARFGEYFPFGFSTLNSQSPEYVSLAYPGKNGCFAPLFLKIQNPNLTKYLRVLASDTEEDGIRKVKVLVLECQKSEVPEHLK